MLESLQELIELHKLCPLQSYFVLLRCWPKLTSDVLFSLTKLHYLGTVGQPGNAGAQFGVLNVSKQRAADRWFLYVSELCLNVFFFFIRLF